MADTSKQSLLAFSAAPSQSTFNFGDHAIRVIVRDGAPWFVATDVCAALGYVNPSKAVADHLDDDERSHEQLDRSRMGSKAIVINESGLYALVLRSRKPEARKFAKWVTSEVLPSIRKTGGYAKPTADADRANKALSLVAEVMPHVSRAIFDAVMTGQNWQAERFMLTFDVDTKGLVPHAKKIDPDAYVLPMDRFHDAIDSRITIEPAVLARLAATCTDRLSRMAHEARPLAVTR